MGNSATVAPMTTRPNGNESLSGVLDVDTMTAKDRANLGPAVKARRVARKMSQDDLANAAGISRKTLGTFEQGKTAPHTDKLRAILEALDVAQVSDIDRQYGAASHGFIAAVVPLFERLPEHLKSDAQQDIVVLLAGKLQRAAAGNVTAFPVTAIEQDEDDDWEAEDAMGYAAKKKSSADELDPDSV